MSGYEIDQGEPAPERRPPPPVEAPAAEREHDARLGEALPAAIATIKDAGRQRHIVDLYAIVLAGLCGQGLGGAPRVDPWNGGATLGLLAAIAGLGVAGWMWRRARVVADALWSLPVPMDDAVIAKLGARDETQRALARQRREAELTTIELLAGDLGLSRSRLRLALWGAGAGTLAGWVCALGGPAGAMAFSASVAAVPGAILGWRIAGGGWQAALIERLVIGGLPACALVAALLCATPWYFALAGAVVVAAAGVRWRQRLAVIAGLAASPPAT